jgi:hypothetical protein
MLLPALGGRLLHGICFQVLAVASAFATCSSASYLWCGGSGWDSLRKGLQKGRGKTGYAGKGKGPPTGSAGKGPAGKGPPTGSAGKGQNDASAGSAGYAMIGSAEEHTKEKALEMEAVTMVPWNWTGYFKLALPEVASSQLFNAPWDWPEWHGTAIQSQDDPSSAPSEVIVFRSHHGTLYIDYEDFPNPSYWMRLDLAEIQRMTNVVVHQQGRTMGVDLAGNNVVGPKQMKFSASGSWEQARAVALTLIRLHTYNKRWWMEQDGQIPEGSWRGERSLLVPPSVVAEAEQRHLESDRRHKALSGKSQAWLLQRLEQNPRTGSAGRRSRSAGPRAIGDSHEDRSRSGGRSPPPTGCAGAGGRSPPPTGCAGAGSRPTDPTGFSGGAYFVGYSGVPYAAVPAEGQWEEVPTEGSSTDPTSSSAANSTSSSAANSTSSSAASSDAAPSSVLSGRVWRSKKAAPSTATAAAPSTATAEPLPSSSSKRQLAASPPSSPRPSAKKKTQQAPPAPQVATDSPADATNDATVGYYLQPGQKTVSLTNYTEGGPGQTAAAYNLKCGTTYAFHTGGRGLIATKPTSKKKARAKSTPAKVSWADLYGDDHPSPRGPSPSPHDQETIPPSSAMDRIAENYEATKPVTYKPGSLFGVLAKEPAEPAEEPPTAPPTASEEPTTAETGSAGKKGFDDFFNTLDDEAGTAGQLQQTWSDVAKAGCRDKVQTPPVIDWIVPTSRGHTEKPLHVQAAVGQMLSRLCDGTLQLDVAAAGSVSVGHWATFPKDFKRDLDHELARVATRPGGVSYWGRGATGSAGMTPTLDSSPVFRKWLETYQGSFVSQSCLSLEDHVSPSVKENGKYFQHIGTHPEVHQRLAWGRNKADARDIIIEALHRLATLAASLPPGARTKKLSLLYWCHRGKHRSVAVACATIYLLRRWLGPLPSLPKFPNLLSRTVWSSENCGYFHRNTARETPCDQGSCLSWNPDIFSEDLEEIREAVEGAHKAWGSQDQGPRGRYPGGRAPALLEDPLATPD